METLYDKCELCPRRCGADRTGGKTGYCRMGAVPVVNLYGLHYGEEPCISGKDGSGTVFFEGCSLGCVFCQNHLISRGATGKGETCGPERLAEIFHELQEMGANNINLVTPMHFAPDVAEAVRMAKAEGLRIPVALNVSGYDSVETLKMFEGLADIYLADFKFYSSELSQMICGAKDYREVAQAALDEMVRQTPVPVCGDDGMLRSGVIVRHLMLPGKLFDTKKVLDLLLDRYGEKIIISLMNQYTPTVPAADAVNKGKLPAGFAGRVKPDHYDAMCGYLAMSDHPCCFMQEEDASGELFIPKFRT
ncbi:MAG: radical SAM protein [Saccharofermentans sp.]|nr:radical SAM protein [Saccharofermentans sp.]